jgi:hypothetical protein
MRRNGRRVRGEWRLTASRRFSRIAGVTPSEELEMPRPLPCLLAALFLVGAACGQKPTREQKVRADKSRVEAEGFWLYNDLPKAFADAKASGKPILVVLRCLPCEECVKLDDDLVNDDPRVRPLLEKFVRVRVVGTNGLDLSLFQFDYDQSFAAFILNADGTVYGRFGTRSHRTEWLGDVSVGGLAKALAGALELHASYPANKDSLAGKRGPAPLFEKPEKFPNLEGKYGAALDYRGNVVKSCIHCHQIGDAIKEHYRAAGRPIPDEVLFPYPHPKSIGLVLDPEERAKVKSVTAGSLAAKAGFETGDEIASLAGQPLLSIADVQWALHNTPAGGGDLKATVKRGGKQVELSLALPPGWRRKDEINWRSSSWGLRRMASGGLLLESASPAERAKAGVKEGEMALRVKHVGEYGAHAAAKKAGFKAGDLVVSFDGRSDLVREADLLAHGASAKKPGDKVDVVVLRGADRLTLTIPMQP